ncbi:MAG: penicillin-binding transpeptidase domain-containing protein, partial [Candidatus Moraniibacteriota bacterium]
ALDPRSGAVRALVSYPGYDNNLFSGGIASDEYAALIENLAHPLFNRVTSGEYPPGSTIKPVIAAAALAERIVTPATTIESRGGISVGKFFFGDWKAHGFTDFRRAIAVSSDVYFYTLGGGYGGIAGLGMERMKHYEQMFGYGAVTGIDLPGEVDGFLPDPDWKMETIGERWYIGDDYHAAIGQGFVTATPLQIVNSIAAIANGGTLYVPHVRDGNWVSKPVPISPDILSVVREGMRETVTEGTAQSLQTLPVAVAGKTGTAQYGNEDKTHGWFVSFAPYEHPELALIVLVEGQPKDSTYHAVPITKAVYEWYFSREIKP